VGLRHPHGMDIPVRAAKPGLQTHTAGDGLRQTTEGPGDTGTTTTTTTSSPAPPPLSVGLLALEQRAYFSSAEVHVTLRQVGY